MGIPINRLPFLPRFAHPIVGQLFLLVDFWSTFCRRPRFQESALSHSGDFFLFLGGRNTRNPEISKLELFFFLGGGEKFEHHEICLFF